MIAKFRFGIQSLVLSLKVQNIFLKIKKKMLRLYDSQDQI